VRCALVPLLLVRFCVAADFNPAAPDPNAAGMDAARLGRIPARMREFVEQGKAAGIVTLVARHGHVAALDATGYLDLDNRTPMRTDSIFRIMSMTKPVTSVAAMILVEEGRLALIDPAEKYLPEFRGQQVMVKCPPGSAAATCLAKPAHPVTLFDLLTHTAGVAVPKAGDASSKTLAEETATVARLPLEFEPGTQWR